MGTRGMDPLIECRRCSEKRLQRQSASGIGDPGQAMGAPERERPHRRERLGTVEKCKAFLRFQLKWAEFGTPQCVATANSFTTINSLTFSNRAERQMSQRGQISASA